MDDANAQRIEFGMDGAAAALYAAATAGILLRFNATNAYAALGAAIAFAGCFYGLRSIVPEARVFALADFPVPTFPPFEADELVLSAADRVHETLEDALELDDVLAEPAPDARVVRLFDPAAMPAPGPLKAGIERHLEEGKGATPPDASQALYDALNELRRSIR